MVQDNIYRPYKPQPSQSPLWFNAMKKGQNYGPLLKQDTGKEKDYSSPALNIVEPVLKQGIRKVPMKHFSQLPLFDGSQDWNAFLLKFEQVTEPYNWDK